MIRTLLLATGVAIATLALAPAASAQGATELGVRLAGSVTRLGDTKATAIGVPAASLGLGSPGVYLAFRASPRIMVGPQANFYWSTSNGVSGHVLHAAAQADYFLSNPRTSASFAFGSVGIVKSSFNDFTPLAFSGGFGHRIRVGDRLTFRIDGRLTRFTKGQGTTLGFGVSLGGLFGRR